MAWTDAAREAAAETRKRRKLTYTPTKDGAHINRGTMAMYLREARNQGMRGKGGSVKAAQALQGDYTNVKGAHFVDQGLTGTAWRYKAGSRAAKQGYPTKGMPKWAAVKFKTSRGI